ncbi:MAG TPA: glycoside hydrolase family 18 protein [Gemmatimonadaceae bacterium]|jgi:chitinase|nr:glycoside hydrolase family 18 protein [Gemmatimonadaceae bacterium]
MNRLLAFLISLIAGLIGTQPDSRAATPAPPAMRVVGYLASWGVRSKGTAIADLPAADLTHLFYAFAEIAPDGSVTMANSCLDVGACGEGKTLPDKPAGNFGELQRLKRRYPHLKLTISIGGWGGSARFSDAALTDSSRRRFASSAIDLFIRKWPGLFDGIDIDWEFPVEGGLKGNVERPEDKRNFTLLLAELRRELDEQGARDHRHYELTIAASARPSEIANIELDQIVPLLDFINVMTYDYHTGGSIAHFNAPLFPAANDPTPELTVDASMRAFQQGGAPREKLLVGVPFFARAYGGVPNVNGGFLQQSSKRPADWRDSDGDWRRLSRTRLVNPRYTRHWEPSAQVPWLYEPRSGTWISYDDPESVRAKMKYVRDNHLGGVVIWEIGADDGRLIREIARGSRATGASAR